MKSIFPLLIPSVAMAGSFPDDTGIQDTIPGIWAVAASIAPGPVDITVPGGALANYGSALDATGPADAGADVQLGVVSLGDGGSASLRFASPVADGTGPDLAVFENGFSSSFLELAHVEVSSDGIHFVRFPSISETETTIQVGAFSFGAIDPTDIHNLAGKYEAGVGTPFDLAELKGVSPWLDISHITHVRVIDVVGSINPLYGTADSLGNLINDPFKTNFNTGGFDLDAIGALHSGPTTPEAWAHYHFPGGINAGDEDDPDLDRIANLLEYALAGDPNSRNGQSLHLTRNGGITTLHWTRAVARTGVTLRLQGSNNLSSWTNLTESVGSAASSALVSGVTVMDSPGTSIVTATVATNHSFFRLKATR